MSNPALVLAICFLWSINNNYRKVRHGIIARSKR
jgi:hypothetical protein